MAQRFSWRAMVVCMVCLGLLVQARADEPALHRDINEHIITLHVEAKDFKGVVTAGDIPVTTFRPDGNGPFPLVVISHGRSASKRAEMGRVRFEAAARYFVRKGFAVAVPTRLGYSGTAALGDPENDGACRAARYDAALQAASQQIAATVARLQQEPWAAKNRVLLVGQSVGGISTVAAAALGIPGVVAAINFAGGHGGNPDQRPGVPCNDSALLKLYAGFGKVSTLPMLWVYTQNDKYFDAAHSKAWADAYNAAGGRAEYRLMGAFGENGHLLFSAGNDIWQPVLDAWLARFGFTTPGALKAPPESGYAAIGEVAKLPYLDAPSIAAGYLKFLDARGEHRAFALNASGNWGWAFGADDVLSRALANCQKASGKPCMLYAADGAVVWRH
jgi:dienelactone hydrolase